MELLIEKQHCPLCRRLLKKIAALVTLCTSYRTERFGCVSLRPPPPPPSLSIVSLYGGHNVKHVNKMRAEREAFCSFWGRVVAFVD
jgi:hypothetical protein